MVRRWVAAALLLGLLVPAARAEPQTVTVRLVRSIAQAPYYIAVGKGYFAQEGITVDSGDIRSALDTIGPLATGQLDVSMGRRHRRLLQRRASGLRPARRRRDGHRRARSMATQPLVRKALWDDGTIRSAKDYPRAQGGDQRARRHHRVFPHADGRETWNDGEGHRRDGAAVLTAARRLQNGAIDAGFLPEPLSTTAQLTGTVVLDETDAGIGEGNVTTFMFASTRFMNERPKVALAFMRAMLRGARDAHGPYLKDPAIAASIAKQTGLKVEAIERAAPYAIDPDLDIAKFEPGLAAWKRSTARTDAVNFAVPLQFDKVIDATWFTPRRRAAARATSEPLMSRINVRGRATGHASRTARRSGARCATSRGTCATARRCRTPD